MKLGYFSTCSLVLSLGLGLWGCGHSKNTDWDYEINDFKVVQVVKSAERDYLCEGALFADSLNVYSKVNVAIEWPEQMGDYNIRPLQDSLIARTFIHPRRTLEESILSSLDNPQGSDTYKMVRIDSIPDKSRAMVLYHGTVVSSVAFSPKFIVYQILTSIYEGGAHGLTVSNFLNYDFAKGEVIDFDRAFKPGSEEALFDVVKGKLMADNGVSSLKELDAKGFFTDQLFLSHNFYLQGYEVVFHYHPYDIAPYATGAVDVRVPFYVVSDYLSPEVLEILSEDSF
ncbi:MAG: RsiV family protein [Muribaculum sp.]|nr:RsiV family protein [Muribaculum sp.]